MAMVFLGLVALGVMGFYPAVQALDYPSGFRLMEVPDPVAERNPAVRFSAADEPTLGQPFRDPRFGTILTRATARGKIRHEYSRFDPFNSDRSLIILQNIESGGFMVFRVQGARYDDEKNLVASIELEEPRWDPVESDLIWGFDGLKIVTREVTTGRVEIVKDFTRDPALADVFRAEPDLYRVTTKGEGEPSSDFRYWALAVQGSQDDYRIRRVICWDRSQDKVLGHLVVSAGEAELIDWVGMSPLGNWVLIGGDPDGNRKTAGLNLARRDLTEFHRLAISTAHADVGLDSQGREVMVMQNNATDQIDLIPLEPGAKPVSSPQGYAGSLVRPLVRLFYSSDDPEGFGGGVHISCNSPGFCVVSTYYEQESASRNWLDKSIILVKLDGEQPRAWYLATVQAKVGAYWEETQATMSRDGSRVLWSSNWGEEVGQEQVFLMELTMPPGWEKATD
jgi:hypothetical protein